MRSENAGAGFAAATAVQPVGAHRFVADLDATWGAGGHPNGGYLLAVIARAALADTGCAHPHAVHGVFVRAASAGRADVEVELLRAGATATYARAVLRQRDKTIVDTTLVLGVPPSVSGDDRSAAPAALPDEAACESAVKTSQRAGMLDRVRLRYDPLAESRGERDDPRIRAWLRLSDGSQPDALTALFATDALPPSVAPLGYRGWAPTAQLSVVLHRQPEPGPLAVTVSAGEVRGGWFDEHAAVADTAGNLVAAGWQLARLPTQRQS